MDVASFCTQSRVLVIAGKGGVGKTTVAATIARMAADAGLSVLLVDLEGKPGLGASFGAGGPLDYTERDLTDVEDADHPGGTGNGRSTGRNGRVRARRITPDDALLQYLADHGLQRVSKRMVSTGILDVVATAIPGIRDVLVLGRVKQLERDGAADLIVVDAPATGHAVTFLTSAQGLLDAARGGPVRAQAAEVVEMLTDARRVRVVLVTLPEELPVSETIEAAFVLEDRAGVRLGPVLVNACDPTPAGLDLPAREAVAAAGAQLPGPVVDALEAARAFTLARHGVQEQEVARLERELPLPQLLLPRLESQRMGPAEVQRLADALAMEVQRLDVDAVVDPQATRSTP